MQNTESIQLGTLRRQSFKGGPIHYLKNAVSA